jgi:hypothetical protein
MKQIFLLSILLIFVSCNNKIDKDDLCAIPYPEDLSLDSIRKKYKGDLISVVKETNLKGKEVTAYKLEKNGFIIVPGETADAPPYLKLLKKSPLQESKLLGKKLSDVLKFNQKEFQVSGFSWDKGGHSFITDGVLNCPNVSLTPVFSPSVELKGDLLNTYRTLLGDRKISTKNSDLKKLKPVVSQVLVFFPFTAKDKTAPKLEKP